MLITLTLAGMVFGLGIVVQPTDATNPPTAEQDHRLMLQRLGIDELRPGADGWNPDAPNAANADEAKATPYPVLPDPLTNNDGSRVTTPEQWWGERRGEIVEHFDREVYGRVPISAPAVAWRVVGTVEQSVAGHRVNKRELIGEIENSSSPASDIQIRATLVTPASASAPVPVIVEFGFDWEAWARARGEEPLADPPTPDWQRLLLEKGWGYAVLIPTSFQADNGAGLYDGVIGLTTRGQPRDPEDWGALRAWAWGASRLLDHLIEDPTVDGDRVGITGLSRYGKAAIVTMAYDQRFATAFVGSSGQGGVKIMRRDFGERVENVASSGEYHWMAGNYLKYAGPLTPNDLPVDAHHLVALCAPRPIFISVGSLNVEGTWIDAVGNFLGAAQASPVYELLGADGLGADVMPPEGDGVLDGDLAFRQHHGGHTTAPNWPFFIDFAARYFERE